MLDDERDDAGALSDEPTAPSVWQSVADTARYLPAHVVEDQWLLRARGQPGVPHRGRRGIRTIISTYAVALAGR